MISNADLDDSEDALESVVLEYLREEHWQVVHGPDTVSYTHLTLPTKRIV